MKTLNDYMAMSYRMEIVEDKEMCIRDSAAKEQAFLRNYPDSVEVR